MFVQNQKEKSLREKNIKDTKEKFKNEFINNYYSIDSLFWSYKNVSDKVQKDLICKINGSIFIYIVLDMYGKMGNSKSINEITSIFKDRLYIKKLMDEAVVYSATFQSGTPFESPISNDIIMKLYDSIIDILDSSEDYLYEYCKNNNSINKFEPEQDIQFFRDTLSFATIYLCSLSFIRAIVLLRNQSNFISNEELYLMYLNLSKNQNMELSYTVEKINPIYLNFYKETFDDEFSFKDFYSLIKLYENKLSGIEESIFNIYENDIGILYSEIDKEIADYSEDISKRLIDIVKEFLSKIDRKIFIYSFEIDLNKNTDIEPIYRILYHALIGHICKKMPTDVFYKLIDEMYWSNIELLCDIHTKEVLEKERDRLLKGDMELENKYIEDKYSFENISSGYEFEEYLRELFIRMGYDVEVTRRSNDQGGDLILKKDGEITVVQAKYYSNTVGNKAIQEVVAAIPYYGANKGMVVTNNKFTNAAIKLAEVNDITLIDNDGLNKIRKFVIQDSSYS